MKREIAQTLLLKLWPTFQVFIAESLHTIGMALLFFVILPELDVVKGAMITNCLCVVPAILGLLSRNSRDSKRFVKVIVDIAAIVAQVTGFIVWPLSEDKPVLWLIPVASLCISLGWWENYVTRQSPIGKHYLYYICFQRNDNWLNSILWNYSCNKTIFVSRCHKKFGKTKGWTELFKILHLQIYVCLEVSPVLDVHSLQHMDGRRRAFNVLPDVQLRIWAT